MVTELRHINLSYHRPQSISHSELSHQEAASITDLQFVTESSIQGYHVYKSIWSPEIGETLSTKKEHNNPRDRFAVAVMKDKLIVGYIPKEILKIF